jgi:Ca2+-binding RTX toxin-like protein
MVATDLSDEIHGLGGDDILYGNAGNDRLYGEGDNDTLNGGEGDDLLNGSEGNDYLEGGKGNDTYQFGRGYGVDTIYDSDSTAGNMDAIQFLEGITAGEIDAVRTGANLELRLIGTEEKLVVNRYFDSSSYRIEKIQFADGNEWDYEYIKSAVVKVSEENDTVYGFDEDEAIGTLGGDDIVYSYGGNDTIDGGLGNDKLYGGVGDDILSGSEGEDKLYGEDGNDTLYGGAGADSLYGSNGNDILDGSEGNDYLEGGKGNDTYVFNGAFGQDIINNGTATATDLDKAIFSYDPELLIFSRIQNNMKIQVVGQTESVLVQNWYTNANAKLDSLETLGGCQLVSSQVDQLIQAMATFTTQTGLTWEQAAQQNNQQYTELLATYYQY